MTPAEVAATLRQFNGWRRDFDDKFEQPDSREISEAIDAAIEMIDRLEAAEKERDDVAQQLVQSERGKRAISDECDALRNEIAFVKEVEFPRKAQAVADAWKGKCKRLEVERDALRAKIEAMEKQESVAAVIKEGDSRYWMSERLWTFPDGKYPLYALPGAQPAPSVSAGALQPVVNWLRNGCDPQEAAKELELLIAAAPEAKP